MKYLKKSFELSIFDLKTYPNGIGVFVLFNFLSFTLFSMLLIKIFDFNQLNQFSNQNDNNKLYIILGLFFWLHINNVIESSLNTIQNNIHILLNFPTEIELFIYKNLFKDSYKLIINFFGIIFLLIFYEIEFNSYTNFIFLFIYLIFIYPLISKFIIFINYKISIFSEIMRLFMKFAFFFTPIIWSIELILNRIEFNLFLLNPLLYIIDSVRFFVNLNYFEIKYLIIFNLILFLAIFIFNTKYFKSINKKNLI